MKNEIEKIKEIEYELVKAFVKRDLNKLDRILADEFIMTDPHRPSCTKEQYIADLEADRISFKSLVIEEMDVCLSEDSAIITGTAMADGRSQYGPYQGQYTFMDVYIRKGLDWHTILSSVYPA